MTPPLWHIDAAVRRGRPSHCLRRYIKVLGERNTGTNYLQQLLELNLDADLLPGTVPPFVPGSAPEFVRDAYFTLTGAANLGWIHAIAPSGMNWHASRSAIRVSCW